MLHAQPGAAHIDGEHVVEIRRGQGVDRAGHAGHAGIVHGDIDTAQPFDGLVDHGADLVFLAHIDGKEGHFDARLLGDLGGGLFAFGEVEAGHGQLGPRAGDGPRASQADAAVGAHHQSSFAAQRKLLVHSDVSLCLCMKVIKNSRCRSWRQQQGRTPPRAGAQDYLKLECPGHKPAIY